jgi:hypothetical protein
MKFKCEECFDTGIIYSYTGNGWWNTLRVLDCECMKDIPQVDSDVVESGERPLKERTV